MDSARQLIRWGIPGWLWTTFLCGFIFVDVLLRAPALLPHWIVLALSQNGVGATTSAVVTAIVASSVGIGFVIYQAYFWGYWRGLRFFRSKPFDRGWATIRDVVAMVGVWDTLNAKPRVVKARDGRAFVGNARSPDEVYTGEQGQKKDGDVERQQEREAQASVVEHGIGEREQTLVRPTPRCDWIGRVTSKGRVVSRAIGGDYASRPSQTLSDRHVAVAEEREMRFRGLFRLLDAVIVSPDESDAVQCNAELANTLWYIAIADAKNNTQLESRYVGLSDIAHALGAGRIAVLLSFATWITLRTWLDIPAAVPPTTRVPDWAIIGACAFLAWLAFKIFSACRRSALLDLIRLRHDVITWKLLRVEYEPAANDPARVPAAARF